MSDSIQNFSCVRLKVENRTINFRDCPFNKREFKDDFLGRMKSSKFLGRDYLDAEIT